MWDVVSLHSFYELMIINIYAIDEPMGLELPDGPTFVN